MTLHIAVCLIYDIVQCISNKPNLIQCSISQAVKDRGLAPGAGPPQQLKPNLVVSEFGLRVLKAFEGVQDSWWF